jgi:hypothetical protein
LITPSRLSIFHQAKELSKYGVPIEARAA